MTVGKDGGNCKNATIGSNKILQTYRVNKSVSKILTKSFSSLDLLVKTLVDNSHKSLRNLKSETVGDVNTVNIINEIEISTNEDRTIQDIKKDFSCEIEKLEEVLQNYISENDPKIVKTEFPDKWNYLNEKLAYPYDYFESIDDY